MNTSPLTYENYHKCKDIKLINQGENMTSMVPPTIGKLPYFSKYGSPFWKNTILLPVSSLGEGFPNKKYTILNYN